MVLTTYLLELLGCKCPGALQPDSQGFMGVAGDLQSNLDMVRPWVNLRLGRFPWNFWAVNEPVQFLPMDLGGAANALLQKSPAIPIEWEFGWRDIPISAGNPGNSPGRSQ
jgi:hypothetical protein